MATSLGSGFDDFDSDELGPDFADDGDGISVPIGNPLSVMAEGAAAARGVAVPAGVEPIAAPAEGPKELLELRGFFVASGPGVYEGATREGEEPRDSHFVDVQDYETGEIRRVWGIALRDEMAQATGTLQLQPGSRVHLIQRGKTQIVTSTVNDRQEMEITKSFANGWTCLPDRGALPSQLAHLMAGINVEGELDRIALRHDMGMDDPRLAGWKQEQMRILRAFGDDPQTVKGWLARQLAFTNAEELALVTQAVELAGYHESDPARRKHEIDLRMAALREMDSGARFNYLMESAKPHLIERNRQREGELKREVAEAIEMIARMAAPTVLANDPLRQAMRSALIQSVDGLTVEQQLEYLAERRSRLVDHLTSPENLQPPAQRAAISKDQIIDASDMTAEEYQQALTEKLALATDDGERVKLLQAELEARQEQSKEAEERLKPIEEFYRRIAAERDVDMLALMIGRGIEMLAYAVTHKMLPAVLTTFQELGGVGAWRRRGCVNELDGLNEALAAAKATDVYQAFVNDPEVRLACGDKPVEEVLRESPELAHTEVALMHLEAQEKAEPPAEPGKPLIAGVWGNVVGAANRMADRISHLSPDHLLKRDGSVDETWMKTMQQGLANFTDQMKETLMPEKVRERLQELIASITSAIKMLLDMLRVRTNSQEQTAESTATPSVGP